MTVPTKDIANILGGGGDDSAVWNAAKGSTLPTTLADPASPFASAGWLSTDGISFARNEDKQVFRGHQGGQIIKRKTASVDDTFKFQCLETTALTLGLLYKGQTPTVATGVATIHVTNQTVNDESAWVLDEMLDDGSMMRYVVPNGSPQLTAEVAWKHDDLTVYEFTVGVNGDYFVITDAPAVVGS
jgi:hypothetical protein